MELGRAMVRNGSGDVELELYPQELAEKGILTIERNVKNWEIGENHLEMEKLEK